MLTVVKTNQETNEFESVNIYTDYPYLNTSDVTHSNTWYGTMKKDLHQKYLPQNLKGVHEYLVKKSEDKLLTNVDEAYL